MDYLVVEGGNVLRGSVEINGAKNAALPILAACLLTSEKVTLRNVPNVSDINTMCLLLESLGAKIIRDKIAKTLEIQSDNIINYLAHYDIVSKMRASIWVLAPLVARYFQAKVSLPGGCALGVRKVDLHIDILQEMGVNISIDHGYIIAESKRKLAAIHYDFAMISVGATITAIMSAVLADGTSVLHNCATEPEIQDLCFFLNQMGAKIKNIGSNSLLVEGVYELLGCDYKIMSDRIEAGSYMIASAITKGNITLTNFSNVSYLDNVIYKLLKTGINISIKENIINIDAQNSEIISSDLQTMVYPGFPTDLQPQFISLMTIAKGVSVVTENIFDNRFMAVPELCRMGADITISNNSAIIKGVNKISGASVTSSDLRGAMSLVLAALAAEGSTIIKRIYHLDRGYENLEKNLINCGAKIRRLKD